MIVASSIFTSFRSLTDDCFSVSSTDDTWKIKQSIIQQHVQHTMRIHLPHLTRLSVTGTTFKLHVSQYRKVRLQK